MPPRMMNVLAAVAGAPGELALKRIGLLLELSK